MLYWIVFTRVKLVWIFKSTIGLPQLTVGSRDVSQDEKKTVALQAEQITK